MLKSLQASTGVVAVILHHLELIAFCIAYFHFSKTQMLGEPGKEILFKKVYFFICRQVVMHESWEQAETVLHAIQIINFSTKLKAEHDVWKILLHVFNLPLFTLSNSMFSQQMGAEVFLHNKGPPAIHEKHNAILLTKEF